jgi:glycosyltransferase involved in cell wall biosynthesis
MKIVYFIDHLRHDGSQRVLRELVEGLGKRGHIQAVVCLNDSWDAALVERLRAAKAEVRIVGKLGVAGGYGLLSTWQWLRCRQFDAAVTLLLYSDVIGRLLARSAGIPFIATSIQTRDVHYSSMQRWLVRQTARWANRIVLCSENIREFAAIAEGASSERTCVVPHGVPFDKYHSTIGRSALCREFGLPSASIILGSVGRLTYQKGYDILLEALARLSRHDFQLLLIGVGEEEQSLRLQAHRLGLEKHVHFAGYRHDVPLLLGSLDIYLQPSRFEGMSLAVIEAMASGCPIVATAVDGTCEVIENGRHGWLVPPEDPPALAATIEEAMSNPEKARVYGNAARQRAKTSFSAEALVSGWENVLLLGQNTSDITQHIQERIS